MKKSSCLLNKEEVVVNASAGDECALIGRNHLAQVGRQPKRERLREQLHNEMDETNGAIVSEGCRILLLRKEGEERLIEPLETASIECV